MKTCNKPLRIYIAGPYSPQNCTLHDAPRIAQRNVDKAIEIANRLIDKGHFVFVPHLSHYIYIHSSSRKRPWKYWIELDLTFLRRWADALFFIAPSRGANIELREAKKLGLKIFYSLDEVPTVAAK